MDSQNKLSALSFIKPKENYYQKSFTTVLELAVFAHSLMLQKESNIDGLDEETLRNKLVKHINQNRGKYGLGRFVFDSEPVVCEEESDKTIGYTDIKITIPSRSAFSSEEQKSYTIECKRLDGYADKNKKYIEEGICRFINGKYAKNTNIAGMIGFIESSARKFKDDKMTSIINDINEKLLNDFKREESEKLQNICIVNDFKNSYKSKHKRKNNLGDINITHLMLNNAV